MADEQVRIRVNVSRSVKGVYTYDCTAELITDASTVTNISDMDDVRFEVLRQSAELVKALDAKYPAPLSEGP